MIVELKTQKQRHEIIDARNAIIRATDQFSDFCNCRFENLEYRGLVQGFNGTFLSALTTEEITDRERNDYPNLEFIKKSFGYEIKAYLVKLSFVNF